MNQKHDCELVLRNFYPRQSQAQEGEIFICTCGSEYVHVCDEAEGCFWSLTAIRLARNKKVPQLIKVKHG